jgi:excisionase family DNA binding protein
MPVTELPVQLEQYWTTRQVADRIGCTESCVKRWLWSKQLQKVKVGSLTRITETELQAFIARSTQQQTPAPKAGLHVM